MTRDWNEINMRSYMGRCVHFGQGDVCAAGVLYADATVTHAPLPVVDMIGRPSGTITRSAPCIDRYNPHGTVCPKREAPTREQAEAREREREEETKRMVLIREAIVAATKGAKGVAGTIPCPACKDGVVRYSRATNAHVRATCSTRGCACWIE